jgi:hypothetical protein
MVKQRNLNAAEKGAVEVTVSFAAAAAGDYADNDVISDSATNGTGNDLVFAGMARGGGGSGRIVKAIQTCSVEAFVATTRLWLFHTDPTGSEKDDNAAFSWVIADRDKLAGVIDFGAGEDFGTVSASINHAVSLSYKCAAGDTNLYGILQARDAFTNESAGMTITITLFAELD